MIKSIITKLLKKNNKFFLYNAISLLSARSLSVISSLLIIPISIDYLGPEKYSTWLVVSSLLAYLAFTDLGLGNGLLNKAAGFKETNTNNFLFFVSSTYYSLIVISLIIFLFGICIYKFNILEIFLVKSQSKNHDAGAMLLVLFTYFSFNLPFSVSQKLLEGFQKAYIYNFWFCIGTALNFIFQIVAINLHLNYFIIIISSLLGMTFSNAIIHYMYFYKIEPSFRPNINYFESSYLKPILKSGVTFLLLSLFTVFANASDSFIIAKYLNSNSVITYESVRKLFFFTMLTQYLIQPLLPIFGNKLANGDIQSAKKIYLKAIGLSLIAGSVIGLPVLFYTDKIISIWIGKQFSPNMLLILFFYIYTVINNYIGVTSTLLNSSKIFHLQLIPLFLTMLSSIVLKIFLVKTIGLTGVILGTIISWFFFFIIPSLFLTNKLFKLSKL